MMIYDVLSRTFSSFFFEKHNTTDTKWSFFLWACAMQGVGYGIIMPIYGAVHLLTSSTAREDRSLLRKSVQMRKISSLDTLPWSLTLGYVLPAVMMSLPVFSSKTHQFLVVVWQLYPVWIVILQFCFAIGLRSREKDLERTRFPRPAMSMETSSEPCIKSISSPSSWQPWHTGLLSCW